MRIARLIVLSNLIAFAILTLGVVLLTELRSQLIGAKIDALTTQGELLTDALAETATVGEPRPALISSRARAVLLRLRLPASVRVRLVEPDGTVLVDTALRADRVSARDLPLISRERARNVRAIKGMTSLTLDQEMARAWSGERAAGVRLGEDGARVVSVSLPVQRVQAVLAVLTLESSDVDALLRNERAARAPFILAAGIVTLLSSVWLSALIARPLRRLSEAADRMRATGATRLRTPDLARRSDEIGDLAQALERMTAALSERIDANSRFAADVSHEIKNPLSSIRSAVETAGSVQDPAARERLLAIIEADVTRLDRLITDISRASRLEAETARGAPDRIDLVRLLGDIVETYDHGPGGASGPAVRLQRAAREEIWVMGQEGPLGQVFRNVLDNARSFSPPDTPVVVHVEAEGPRERRLVRVAVEDRGPGIPPENLETIFQRFYTQRPKGAAFGSNSGLGLAIARQIVEAHKGRIWAENRLEGGARFVVELPCLAETERRHGHD